MSELNDVEKLNFYEYMNTDTQKKIEQEKQDLITKVDCLTQIQYCLDMRLEDDKDWKIGDKKVKKIWTSTQCVNVLASKNGKDYLLKINVEPWEENK